MPGEPVFEQDLGGEAVDGALLLFFEEAFEAPAPGGEALFGGDGGQALVVHFDGHFAGGGEAFGDAPGFLGHRAFAAVHVQGKSNNDAGGVGSFHQNGEALDVLAQGAPEQGVEPDDHAKFTLGERRANPAFAHIQPQYARLGTHTPIVPCYVPLMRSRFGLFLILGCSLLTGQEKKPVTLEALTAQGMPPAGRGMPVWSPLGGRFVHREGKKLHIYTLSAKESKEILDTAPLETKAQEPPKPAAFDWENRRVREQTLQWSADGKHLLLVIKGDLFLWTEASGEVKQLTSTPVAERDPKLSPDSTRVGFRRGSDLYTLEIASGRETRLTHDGSETLLNGKLDWVYPEELGIGTAWWWSPDSKQVAFLQFDVSPEPVYGHVDHLPVAAVSEPQRYPKAGTPNADVRCGVVNSEGGRTQWMNFGEIRDHLLTHIYWTPDSKRVVAHRLNRVQDRLWILAAEAATGEAVVLHEERDPYWVNLTGDLEFLPDGRFLRLSEKDGGYRHIYLHRADGRQAARLTRGDWEVASIACVDQRGGRVYYISSEVSPLERHLYSVDFNGRNKRRLSPGTGSYSASFSPDCGAYLETHSSLESPSRSVLRAAGGEEIAIWREANLKAQQEYDIRPTELHRFKNAQGIELHARLIKPAGFDPAKKYPAIVMVYGGPHAQSVRNSYSGLSWDQVLAHKGFVIWQVDNRGSAGRGHGFEAPVYRRMGKVELEDQLDGVKYLLSLGFTDEKRIGVYGWSYGGYMTLYCLLHAPDTFAAGAAGAAVTHWRNYDTIYTERYMGLPQENEEGYRLSAPVNAAANLKGKLMLIHNLGDDNVLFANALQMMNALQQAGKPFETLIYPQKSHGVTGKASRHMREGITRFFVESLGAGK